jgi:cell division septation protein DedD
MAENRRGKEKRYYYSRGQMVLLGGAFTVASIIIFLLGILVGKGIEESKIAKNEAPLVKIPVKPSPQASNGAGKGQSKEELTFYNTLTKSPGPRPAAEEKTNETNQPEKMTKGQATEIKPQAPDEAPPPAKASEKRVEKLPPPVEAPAAKKQTTAAEPSGNGKVWTVQVNAFPDERSAKIWVDRLKNKGYNAYVTETQDRGKTWYRVRVGKYGSREEADKIVEKLRNKENFTNAFAASR